MRYNIILLLADCSLRQRRRESSDKTLEMTKTVTRQPTDLADVEWIKDPPTSDPLAVGTSPSTISSRVPIITVDRWAVRPQPWLSASSKPGRYSDVIGPFD